jgi:hypothetical protein
MALARQICTALAAIAKVRAIMKERAADTVSCTCVREHARVRAHVRVPVPERERVRERELRA